MGTFMEYFNAFWVGGLICALCQILLDRTKMLPGRIMVTLVSVSYTHLTLPTKLEV